MVGAMTPEQRTRLDQLVTVPEGERQSPLDRLRDCPYIQSHREIGRALDRLEEVRRLTEGLPSIDRLSPGRITALARYASATKAQAVWRLPDDRRAATLLAFIRTLEASASDDVIDLFDAVSTSMFSEASTAAKQARLRSLRDLDASALKLRDAAIVILDPETPDDAVRSAVFQLIDTSTLAAAVERVGELAEPHGDTLFLGTQEVQPQSRLHARPADGAESRRRALRKAATRDDRISSCRSFRAQAQWATANRLCPQTRWLPQIRSADGSLDLTGYRLCVLDGLRRAIRRRDVFPARSLLYADPRNGLLSGPAWEAARPTICRTVGVSRVAEGELGRLSERLDRAFRETARRVPANSGVTIVSTADGPDLSVERLEKLEEPASLVVLRTAIEEWLPRLDLPELIMEMHARTGFADLFTHASEGGARAEDIATSVCAVLVAEATNTGFEPLVRLDAPALPAELGETEFSAR
jgi:hypothetical protein